MAIFNYKVPGDALKEDIINNTEPQTVWQKMYLHLKKKGYEVYSPGQKRDKCKESYVVIKDKGTYAQGEGNIVGYQLFQVDIFHPLDSYSTMEFYVENIKEALKDIRELKATGNVKTVILDDEIQAYKESIEYKLLKILRR